MIATKKYSIEKELVNHVLASIEKETLPPFNVWGGIFGIPNDALGVYFRSTGTIWLRRTHPAHKEHPYAKELIYLHELGHWSVHVHGVKLAAEEEEMLCDNIAKVIYQKHKKEFSKIRDLFSSH